MEVDLIREAELELKPCPFCGSEIEIEDDPVMADCEDFKCYECQYEMRFLVESRKEAIQLWNTRKEAA